MVGREAEDALCRWRARRLLSLALLCVSPGLCFLTAVRSRCPLSCPSAPQGSGTVMTCRSRVWLQPPPFLCTKPVPSPQPQVLPGGPDLLCPTAGAWLPDLPPLLPSPLQAGSQAAPVVIFLTQRPRPLRAPNLQQLRGCGNSGWRGWGACSPFFSDPGSWAWRLSSAPQGTHRYWPPLVFSVRL